MDRVEPGSAKWIGSRYNFPMQGRQSKALDLCGSVILLGSAQESREKRTRLEDETNSRNLYGVDWEF